MNIQSTTEIQTYVTEIFIDDTVLYKLHTHQVEIILQGVITIIVVDFNHGTEEQRHLRM